MTLPTAVSNTPNLDTPSAEPAAAERTLTGEQANGSTDQLAEQLPAPPPTDLYSDEPPLETTLHLRQMILLLNCLHWIWKDRDDYFAAGNLTIYYSLRERKDEDFRGPDFFVVLDTEPHPRKSWTIWEEDGKYPNVIVELLSDSTAETDRDFKKRLYADTFRTPEYFWFNPDPEKQEFAGFALVRGKYEAIAATDQGWLWSEQLQLYLGIHDEQLRYFELDGKLVPTPDEAAITALAEAAAAQEEVTAAQEEVTAAQEEVTAAQEALTSEQQRSARLAEKLRELGIDPDSLD
ncbi:Uma2 family endonuclease [cf. Phormidesmis sp. LEGE 11477]|uniref:Uma2 family endonuclease n=1 Tax=cf. Phormidesmis sp. LEGE 11477 TaxID=1828680 RepID=UPI00187F1C63|nr:Uma2 family endonuclease [cf. Phormidesmis sp. LEGE 11477]MBE9064666.1 Uma2 family endonuclease [cf. Phormidesmis sp. LEGE 11477]